MDLSSGKLLLQWEKIVAHGEGTIPNTMYLIQQLMHEHEIIRRKIDRIADLSEDLEILAKIKDKTRDLTIYQYGFLNDRRISLRQNLSQFTRRLRIHYTLEEKVLRPFLGNPARQILDQQHRGIMERLTELTELLLNLSPVGLLFNGSYFKYKFFTFSRTIGSLNSLENSLLEIARMYNA
jgi:hypothetical protein